MVPWIAILVGGVFVWLAVRVGFYEIWSLLFNISVSVYAGIFLSPLVGDLLPTTGVLSAYGTAMSMIVVAGGCFALLYGLSYVFLTGQFNIPFPKVFDVLLAGVFGFLTGFLLCSFIALVFTTTPWAHRDWIEDLGFNAESQKANITCMSKCCDVIYNLTGGDTTQSPTETAITQLLAQAQASQSKKPTKPVDPNAPAPTPPHELEPSDT